MNDHDNRMGMMGMCECQSSYRGNMEGEIREAIVALGVLAYLALLMSV
jgi:hypothetical protein